MIICPNCQKQLPDGANFCDGCGTQFQQAVVCPNCGSQTSAAQPFCQTCGAQFEAPKAEKKFNFNLDTIKNLPKKTLGIIGGAAVAVVALIIIIAVVLSSGMPNYAIYTKDGDLVYRDLGKKSSVAIDDDATSAMLSSDGKTLFFNKNGDLYYKNINKKNDDGEKWVSGIGRSIISENGKYITYLKDGDLYQKKLGADDATKIAKEVYSFTTTPDGSKILYVTNESDVYYVKKAGKTPVAVVKGVDEYGIQYISDDLKTLIYIKEGNLYSIVAGKEANKIASEVDNVYALDTKTIYYSTREEVKEGEYITDVKRSLFFYNGKESTKLVADIFAGVETGNVKKGYIVYTTEEVSKDEETQTIEYFFAEGKKTYKFFDYTIKYDDNGQRVAYDYIAEIIVTENGKDVYYLVKTEKPNVEDNKPVVGDLYKASAGKKITSAKKIDSDVYSLSWSTESANKAVYSKEYNNEKNTYDLYVDKKLVSNDVKGFTYSEVAKGYFFQADDSYYFYKTKKVLITAEEVHDLTILPTGDVLYITDVSESSGKGDLMLFNGKKSKKIDSDVSSISDVYYLEQQFKDRSHLHLSAPGAEKQPVVDQY